MWFVASLLACNGGKDSGEVLAFEDVNNYEFSGEFDIEATNVGPNADFCIDWSSLATDIRGRPVDPTDVDQIALMQFDLDQPAVMEQIDTNQLRQDDAAYQYLWDQTGGATSACAVDFEIIGNFFDPALLVVDDETTWLVSLIDLDTGKNDVLSTVFVVPSDESTNHEVAFADSSASLTYDVSIDEQPPIKVPAGEPALVLDWSAVTNDVNGVLYDPLLGDELLIARYDDYASVADVESVFLRLDSEASNTWVANVRGETDIDLSTVEDANNDGFPGFEPGVWLVAVSCTTCTSPVPLLLAWIEVQ